MRLVLIAIGIGLTLFPVTGSAENLGQNLQHLRRETIKLICLNPVGMVNRQGKSAYLEIYPEYAPALEGLQDFSHLWVF